MAGKSNFGTIVKMQRERCSGPSLLAGRGKSMSKHPLEKINGSVQQLTDGSSIWVPQVTELHRGRVSRWSISQFFSTGRLGLSSATATEHLLVAGSRISAAVQQPGASALGFTFSPSTEALQCFSVQSVVITKMMNL